MCDVPEQEPIPPQIKLNPNAGKATSVKLKRNNKDPRQTGLAKMRSSRGFRSVSEMLAGLTIGGSQ